MGAALAAVTAITGLLSAGAAVKSAFSKPKQPKAQEFMATPQKVKTPDVLSPEDKDPTKKGLARFGPLIATSPLGVTEDPLLGRSKLLGN